MQPGIIELVMKEALLLTTYDECARCEELDPPSLLVKVKEKLIHKRRRTEQPYVEMADELAQLDNHLLDELAVEFIEKSGVTVSKRNQE